MIWLLTVVAGLSGDPALRQREAATELLNRFAVMPKRVAGRVLGLLIHAGMTEGQVLQILGKPDLFSGGSVGGLSFDWFKYLDYGLTRVRQIFLAYLTLCLQLTLPVELPLVALGQ
jgi:hypothetical protein